MIRHDHPGLFLALEGLGGSGVHTISGLVASSLEREGYRVFKTGEPTKGIIGGLIRARLMGEWKTSPETLQLLFTADRAQHLDHEILPALGAGKIVVTERYSFSSVAYGALEIPDPEWLKRLNERFILPDFTFLIKVRPKICALRLKEQHYEIELYREEQKLAQVWKNYEELAKSYAGIHIINGERGEAEIVSEIKSIILDSLTGGELKDKSEDLDRIEPDDVE